MGTEQNQMFHQQIFEPVKVAQKCEVQIINLKHTASMFSFLHSAKQSMLREHPYHGI